MSILQGPAGGLTNFPQVDVFLLFNFGLWIVILLPSLDERSDEQVCWLVDAFIAMLRVTGEVVSAVRNKIHKVTLSR